MKPAIKTLIIFSCVALLYACTTIQQTTRQTLDAINHTLSSVDSTLKTLDTAKNKVHEIINKADTLKKEADTIFQLDAVPLVLFDTLPASDTQLFEDSAGHCLVNNTIYMNCACEAVTTAFLNDTIFCSCNAAQRTGSTSVRRNEAAIKNFGW